MGRFDEIPKEAQSYGACNAVFWLHEGVLYGKHLPDTPNITLEDAIQVLQKLKEMTGGDPVPLFFDGRGLGWLSLDARAYVRANAPDVFSHAAVVVKHDLIRLLSHAFLGIAGMEMPIQLFTDEDAAWEYAVGNRTGAA